MYVTRYGSETSCPVYDPVLPKWDGKENIAIAHARALKEVETVNIAPIDRPPQSAGSRIQDPGTITKIHGLSGTFGWKSRV